MNRITVWTSYGPDGKGDVYMRLFDNQGPVPTARTTFDVRVHERTDGNQRNPSVAVDADGDFAIVWNGKGGQTDPLNPADPDLIGDKDSEGVFIRHFHAGSDFVTVQSRVNRTETGIQQFPTIGMEPDGDMIVKITIEEK